MDTLPIKINVSTDFYLKNPDESVLGRTIVTNSIELIHELGFEAFTIKKLSTKIGSPESSVYRYFESKHMILVYLIQWYWTWIEYRLVFETNNLSSPDLKLRKAIKVLTETIEEDSAFSHINEILLDKIIITEAVKAYFTKYSNNDSIEGHFAAYTKVVQRVSTLVLEIKPKYQFSHMLISTIIEGSHQQRFFAKNLPSLTDINPDEEYITKFYTELIFNDLKE